MQTRDESREIAVARALAVAVDRALHLHRSGAHGGEGVGDAETAVVVRMDAERGGGEVVCGGAKDRSDLVRQTAAVGVAEHDQIGTAVAGGGQGGKRVVGIVLVTVEKMLGVVDHLAAMTLEMAHGVGDHGAVFRRIDAEHLGDVQTPAFAEDRHDRSHCRQQQRDLRIVGRREIGAARTAEGR